MITYNHEKYISQSIESGLMQKTTFPFKIYIGEDCSTDSTRTICSNYKNKFPDIIDLILQGRNVGPQRNLMSVLDACIKSGSVYTAILEGDDYWTDPYKLQKQIDFLETNPDYGMVFSDIIMVNERNNTIATNTTYEKIKSLYGSGQIFWALFRNNFINALTVCVRSEILRKLVDEIEEHNKWYIYDYWLWLSISMDFNIKFFNEKLAAYRIHEEGISKNKTYLTVRTPLILLDIISKLKKHKPNLPQKYRSLLALKLLYIVRNKSVNIKSKFKAFKLFLYYFNSLAIISKKYRKNLINGH